MDNEAAASFLKGLIQSEEEGAEIERAQEPMRGLMDKRTTINWVSRNLVTDADHNCHALNLAVEQLSWKEKPGCLSYSWMLDSGKTTFGRMYREVRLTYVKKERPEKVEGPTYIGSLQAAKETLFDGGDQEKCGERRCKIIVMAQAQGIRKGLCPFNQEYRQATDLTETRFRLRNHQRAAIKKGWSGSQTHEEEDEDESMPEQESRPLIPVVTHPYC